LQDYYEELVKRQALTRYARPEQLARAMNQLGTVLRLRGQFVKAREVLDQADQLCGRVLQSDPGLASARARRPRRLLERGRVVRACCWRGRGCCKSWATTRRRSATSTLAWPSSAPSARRTPRAWTTSGRRASCCTGARPTTPRAATRSAGRRRWACTSRRW